MKQELNKNIRYAEYYDMQEIFDGLYAQSKENMEFNNLTEIIFSKENILLAYRTIKSNKGSKTGGVDKLTIDDIGKCTTEEIVNNVRYYALESKHGYRPKPVKRVDIPKQNGKTRPLGIPCIWDRLIQQCIKQVLEPICEAKFSPNSYGFRPDTSVEHAIGAFYKGLQRQKLFYAVEIDIQSFFDEVNHSKLIKQIWSLGIRDKHLIYLIKQILKAPIKMPNGEIVIPTKGTPQGGILSPLLANINLNEYDQWVDSQWQTNPLALTYAKDRTQEGKGIDKSKAYRKMRKTNLKEVYLIRYADDIRILTPDYNSAKRIMIASKDWLNTRLKLTLSEEKTRIVDTRNKYSEFLGFKIKAKQKGSGYIVESHMSNKSFSKVKDELKSQIKNIAHPRLPERTIEDEIRLYNSMVLGIQNYYRYATHVQLDCDKINWMMLKSLNNRLSGEEGTRLKSNSRSLSEFERKRFGNTAMIRFVVCAEKYLPLYPIGCVKTKFPMCRSNKFNRYTPEGRNQNNTSDDNLRLMYEMMREASYGRSGELMDNRISLFSAQKWKCAISGVSFETLDDIHCHHIIPKSQGGTDEYNNLVLIFPDMHKLIHATQIETIQNIINKYKLKTAQINKINHYRSFCGNEKI